LSLRTGHPPQCGSQDPAGQFCCAWLLFPRNGSKLEHNYFTRRLLDRLAQSRQETAKVFAEI